MRSTGICGGRSGSPARWPRIRSMSGRFSSSSPGRSDAISSTRSTVGSASSFSFRAMSSSRESAIESAYHTLWSHSSRSFFSTATLSRPSAWRFRRLWS